MRTGILLLAVIIMAGPAGAKTIDLKLNLPAGFAAKITTEQVSETITEREDVTFRRRETSVREYGLECMKLTDEKQMLLLKSFPLIVIKDERAMRDGPYEVEYAFDSREGTVNDADLERNALLFSLGQRIAIRVNPDGSIAASGGADKLAAVITMSMGIPRADANDVMMTVKENLEQVPAFLTMYPGKIKEGKSWQSPYFFSRSEDFENADWTWTLTDVKDDTAFIEVVSAGPVETTQETEEYTIVSDLKQDSRIEMQVDVETGLIRSADIRSEMTGEVRSRKKDAAQGAEPESAKITSLTTGRIVCEVTGESE